VGDLEFQARSRDAIEGIIKSNKTVILVSHGPVSITTLCNRALWIEAASLPRGATPRMSSTRIDRASRSPHRIEATLNLTRPMEVLLLCDYSVSSAGTTHDHIDALVESTGHRVSVLNSRGYLDPGLPLEAFDCVVSIGRSRRPSTAFCRPTRGGDYVYSRVSRPAWSRTTTAGEPDGVRLSVPGGRRSVRARAAERP